MIVVTDRLYTLMIVVTDRLYTLMIIVTDRLYTLMIVVTDRLYTAHCIGTNITVREWQSAWKETLQSPFSLSKTQVGMR